MDKAYRGITWENRPSTASPIDEINLNDLSRGVSTIDDRVIADHDVLMLSVCGVYVDNNTGELVVLLNNGQRYQYNPGDKIYETIRRNQQAAQTSFDEVAVNFRDVYSLLDDMDLKIDISYEGANRGISNLRTEVLEKDGYYRREMSGISQRITQVETDANNGISGVRNDLITYKSSITQTTEAIQLSVSQVSQSVDELGEATDERIEILQSQINVTAGSIALKVSKHEIIQGLEEEFGSGIHITPDNIIIASTGALIVNTRSFKLDEEGNAEFAGTVFMENGYVGGYPIMTVNDGGGYEAQAGHALHAWKLQSAAVSALDERYYTYMTANKHLTVSNDETGGHTKENDTAKNCTIGSPNYPWKAGYFKKVKINDHNSVPEGLLLELTTTGWEHEGSCYKKSIFVNKVFEEIMFSIEPALTDDGEGHYTSTADLIYKYNLQAFITSRNEVTIYSNAQISEAFNVMLVAEEYTIVKVDPPELKIEFNQSSSRLNAMWDSIDDASNFVKWVSEEIVVEVQDPETGEWSEEVRFPRSEEDPIEKNAYSDVPCSIGKYVIGSSEEEEV